jgi:hypothetical protein
MRIEFEQNVKLGFGERAQGSSIESWFQEGAFAQFRQGAELSALGSGWLQHSHSNSVLCQGRVRQASVAAVSGTLVPSPLPAAGYRLTPKMYL